MSYKFSITNLVLTLEIIRFVAWLEGIYHNILYVGEINSMFHADNIIYYIVIIYLIRHRGQILLINFYLIISPNSSTIKIRYYTKHKNTFMITEDQQKLIKK